MRIAISGTHASGKSTLIDAFCARHPEYGIEPEPYAVLSELYGETFAEKPAVDDFERQLEYQLEVLARHSRHDQVIFERCPADFLGYMLAMAGDHTRVDQWNAPARAGLRQLDLIVFLPLNEAAPIEIHESEDLILREEVDDLLRDIFLGGELELFAASAPAVIEERGSIDERVAAIEDVLAKLDR